MKKNGNILSVVKVLVTNPVLGFSLLKNILTILLLKLKFLFTGQKLLVISLVESLGDIVATEPVARYAKALFKKNYVIWVLDKQYKTSTQSNPSINKTVTVDCLTEWIFLKTIIAKKNIIDLHIPDKICNKHHFINQKPNPFNITIDNYFDTGNLLYSFSRSAGIEVADTIAPKLYFEDINLPVTAKNYIVVHTSSNMPVKSLSDSNWNQLAVHLLANSNDVHIIEIGFERKIVVADKRIINFTGKKELQEIASLIKHCQLYIGIDSGFAHFANAFEKESLIFIGWYANFKNYMPYSGWLQSHKDSMILYYDGLLPDMPFEFATNKLNQKIDQ